MKSRNNEFSHIIKERREGGGCCRSFFRFVLILPVLLVLLWACSHEGIETYATFNPPRDSIAQENTNTYNRTWVTGSSLWTYTPDNLEIHFSVRNVFPTYMYGAGKPNKGRVSVHAVNSYGKKMHYRFIIYTSSGTEVFRSGLMLSDEEIQINGLEQSSGLRYDVYISDFDEEGNQIAVDSSGPIIKMYFTYTYYTVSLNPEGEEETLSPTEYINLDDFSGVQMPTWGFRDHDEMGGFLNFARFVGDNWRFLLGLRWAGFIFGTCIMISLTIFIMRGR